MKYFIAINENRLNALKVTLVCKIIVLAAILNFDKYMHQDDHEVP